MFENEPMHAATLICSYFVYIALVIEVIYKIYQFCIRLKKSNANDSFLKQLRIYDNS